MDNGSKEASEVIRLTMDGIQLMLKVSGKVTNELLEFFAALQKSEATKSSGRQRLKKMLASGSELKVFTLKGQDKFKVFANEAKKWGVVYSVIRRTDADKKGEIYEVLIKAEDASKLNRMIEKFGLMASVAVETIAEKNSKNDVSQKEGREKEISDAREIINKMLEPTTQEKAIMQMEDGEIPGHIATDIENQFVASLEESEERIILNGIPLEERPSVRERITKIINGNKDDNKENKLQREALKSVIDVGKEQPWKEMKYLRD